MGTWGHAPWDSDSYGDLTDPVRDAYRRAVLPKLNAALNKVATDRDPWAATERWAAIGMVIVAYQSTYLDDDEWYPLVQRALELYQALANDREWLAQWRRPRDLPARGRGRGEVHFKRVFKAVGQELEDMLASYSQPRQVLVQMLFDPRGE